LIARVAWAGRSPYEFAAAGLWIAHGDPRLLRRLLAAYRHSFDPRELLAYMLLHVHSNLPECLSHLPDPPEPTLESLALTWFSTGS
jgi:hygromycin-B 7''-O-kinase